jgi:Fibronectin type III domain
MQAIFSGVKQTRNIRKPRAARLEIEQLESRNLPSPAVAPSFALTPISASEIDITWSDVSGPPVANYVVNEMNSAGSWLTLETVASGAGGYTEKVTGLGADTPYEFEVGGENPPFVQGGRLISPPSSFATPQTAITFVTAPSFTLASGSSSIQVQWQQVTTWDQKLVDQYTIDWWANGVLQKPINVITDSTPTSWYTISNLNDADTYQVQVGAVCPDQNATSWSTPETAAPLAAPGFALSSPEPTQIAVNWGDVPQATAYEIQLIHNAVYTIVYPNAITDNYTFSGLLPSATYSVNVISFGPWGSASKSTQSITTQSDVPVVSASPKSTTQIDLSWNADPEATFDVEEVTGSSTNPTYKILNTGVTGTTTQCTGLATNSAYSFAVRADGPWGDSDWSTATPSTYVYPTAPTSFTATAQNSTTIKFTWTGGPTTTTGYSIYYTSGAEVYYQAVNTTTVTLSSFSPASTYSFVVQVDNPTGLSSFSPVATATTWPSAPVFYLTKQSPSSVWVAWDPVSGANQYDIDYWIDGEQSTTEQTTTATGTSDLISGLQSDTTYDFNVAADNTSSGGGASFAAKSQQVTTISVAPSQFQSGYVAKAGSNNPPFTEAFGTWVVPDVTNTVPFAGSEVSMWVGIDDNSGNVPGLPQIGMTWDSTNDYWPWVEIAGNGTGGKYIQPTDLNNITNSIPNQGPINIQHGDTISAGLTYDSSTTITSTYTFYFQDTAQNGSVTQWSSQVTTTACVPSRTNALWMVEDPSSGREPYAPLANFNSMTFSGAWASNGTTTGPITDFGLTQWNMNTTGNNNGGIDQVGPITNPLFLSGWQEPSGDWSSAFSVNFVSTLALGIKSPILLLSSNGTPQIPITNAQSIASQLPRLASLDPLHLPVPKLLSGTRGTWIANTAPPLETTEQFDDVTGLFDGSFAGPYVDTDNAAVTSNLVTSTDTEASAAKPQTDNSRPSEPTGSDESEASPTDDFLLAPVDDQPTWHKRYDVVPSSS